MSEQTDPIVQAAAEVLARHMPEMAIGSRITEAVVAAVEPLIRAQIADEIASHAQCTCDVCNAWHQAASIARGDAQ